MHILIVDLGNTGGKIAFVSLFDRSVQAPSGSHHLVAFHCIAIRLPLSLCGKCI
jgi:hypothetical protein